MGKKVTILNLNIGPVTILSTICTVFSISAKAEINPYKGYVNNVLTSTIEQAKASVRQSPVKEKFTVVEYLPTEEPTVILSAGRKQGIVDGATLYSYRQNTLPMDGKPHIWVKTGKLKAIHVDQDFTFAKLIGPGDKLSKAFFPHHPDTMAGDLIREARFKIVRNPVMTPTKSIPYKELFEDPMADPINFELTPKGKALLKGIAESYQKLHVPILMVESYTDSTGPSDANQVESYQRALTIRHYLVDELGFHPSRVVAIGYGESNQLDQRYLDGYQNDNRRIVLKVNVHVAPRH